MMARVPQVAAARNEHETTFPSPWNISGQAGGPGLRNVHGCDFQGHSLSHIWLDRASTGIATMNLHDSADDEIATCIEMLERQMLDPDQRKNAEWLDNVLHEDFVEYGRSGGIHDKSEVIKALTAEAIVPTPIRVALDFHTRLLSRDIALVTYVTIRRPAGKEEIRSRRSSIWARAGNRWQIIFHQGTPIP